jgi:hypothetical protein
LKRSIASRSSPIASAAALLAILALAACATRTPHPESFAFAVIGDLPYNRFEETAFDDLVDAMNAEPLAFALHVGDVKAGSSPCTDAAFEERKRRMARLAHPFVFIPGDNDWVDCRRERSGGMDPLESLARLRAVFFGARPLLRSPPGERWAAMPAMPENQRWMRAGVSFVTLNIQGSNDNRGFDAASDRDARDRFLANKRWLEEAFATPGTRAVVVAFHANPLKKSVSGAYDEYLALLREHARRAALPVLVVHGDTHLYRADRPFTDERGATIANLQRLETFGSPLIGWVRVGVDPGDPVVFSPEPRGGSLPAAGQ